MDRIWRPRAGWAWTETGLPRVGFLSSLNYMKYRLLLALLLAARVISAGALGSEPTAFELIKEGNKHVGEEARDKVVELRSERSVGALAPNVWFVVFYDPDATAKATEVKFAAGKKVSVKRPARVLEFVTGNRSLDRSKFKIDSDKALKLASEEPILKRVELKASQMWLQRHEDHEVAWKIRLWAAKLDRPGSIVDIGEVFVDAQDGKVYKTDLHINRVQ